MSLSVSVATGALLLRNIRLEHLLVAWSVDLSVSPQSVL